MCESCWEGYGSPKIDNWRTRKSAELARAVEDSCSVNLHVILDDWNLENEHLYPEGHLTDPEIEFLEHFRTLSLEERASAMALFEGYIK